MTNKKLHLPLLLACLVGVLSIGYLSGLASVLSITNWYTTLRKPIFNPPNYLFGPVWTLLYILMGISFYRIIRLPSSILKKNAILIFSIQLLLNAIWSFLFFYYKLPGLALIEILVLWGTILSMLYYFKQIDRIAFQLQIPYLCWVSFASILNFSIWYLNS